MLVQELTAVEANEWDEFVDGRGDSTLYHLRAWREIARSAYRLRAPFLIARDAPGGPVRGVLPLFVIGHPLRRYVTTGLFGAYGSVLADSGAAHQALLEQACRIADNERARYLLHKSVGDEPLSAAFWRRDLCVIAKMPLEGDPEAQWRALRAKTRNAVRKALRSGLEVRAGMDHIGAYYDVLSENMHRKGTPIYGFPFMRELARCLRDRSEVLTVWAEQQIVAAALVVRHKSTVYVPFASSRPSALRMNPNNLLYWEIIRRSCEQGMKTLDLGRSPRGSGALAFKRNLGATPVPQPFLIYAARGRPPRMELGDRQVRWLVSLWRRLPRALADRLGPSVCAKFLA